MAAEDVCQTDACDECIRGSAGVTLILCLQREVGPLAGEGGPAGSRAIKSLVLSAGYYLFPLALFWTHSPRPWETSCSLSRSLSSSRSLSPNAAPPPGCSGGSASPPVNESGIHSNAAIAGRGTLAQPLSHALCTHTRVHTRAHTPGPGTQSRRRTRGPARTAARTHRHTHARARPRSFAPWWQELWDEVMFWDRKHGVMGNSQRRSKARHRPLGATGT